MKQLISAAYLACRLNLPPLRLLLPFSDLDGLAGVWERLDVPLLPLSFFLGSSCSDSVGSDSLADSAMRLELTARLDTESLLPFLLSHLPREPDRDLDQEAEVADGFDWLLFFFLSFFFEFLSGYHAE